MRPWPLPWQGSTAGIVIDGAEKAGYVGNCIALGERGLWMSACALGALRPATRKAIEAHGLAIHSVELDELEKPAAACAA